MKSYPIERVASFDVDAQNCFTPLCPEELPVPGGHEIVSELNSQGSFAKYRVGSKDAHSLSAIWLATKENPQFTKVEGENVDVRWNAHAIVGTKGYELLSGLPKVIDYDYFVFKGIELDLHPYGACYHDLKNCLSTGVIEYLHSKNVELIIVGGLALDYCVKTTVMQLVDAGFDVVVNLASTKAISEEGYTLTVAELKLLGVRFVKDSKDLSVDNGFVKVN